jgi:hypothetical protein
MWPLVIQIYNHFASETGECGKGKGRFASETAVWRF